MTNGLNAKIVCALVVGMGLGIGPAAAQKPYHIESKWSVPGNGGWDYLTVDSAAHRLYIAHGTKVDIQDLDTGKTLGTIHGLKHCHGIVIAPDGKTGFISDGGSNEVVVFDPAKMAKVDRIPTGGNPDGMAYEPATETLWVFNGTSSNATVIDVAQRKAIATVGLPGRPEFPVADGTGAIFVNLEDKNAIARLDAKAQKVTATWPLAGCKAPSGLAFDKAGSRLFSVCDGKKMAVTDAKTGESLATPTIGNEPDAAGYDAKNKFAFSSNGDGTLTVVDAGHAGYPVAQTLATQKGARTMAFDETTGRIYLVTARAGKLAPGAKRAAPVPGSFTVLVVGRD